MGNRLRREARPPPPWWAPRGAAGARSPGSRCRTDGRTLRSLLTRLLAKEKSRTCTHTPPSPVEELAIAPGQRKEEQVPG